MLFAFSIVKIEGIKSNCAVNILAGGKDEGFDENMYLDSATRTKVEETSGANFLFVTKDGKVYDHGKEICFPSGMTEMGPVTKKLYDTLTGIQMGRIEAPEGWIREIKVK